MDSAPFRTDTAKPALSRLPGSGQAGFGQGSASALSMKWSALHDAAATVATIAQLPPVGMTKPVRHFPAIIRDIGGRARERAERQIEELNAVLEPGVAALLSAYARGANPRAAAQALCEEFIESRDAIMQIVPEDHRSGSTRFA